MRKPTNVNTSSRTQGGGGGASGGATTSNNPLLNNAFAASAVAAGKRRQQELFGGGAGQQNHSPASHLTGSRGNTNAHHATAGGGAGGGGGGGGLHDSTTNDFGLMYANGSRTRNNNLINQMYQGDPGETFDVSEIDLSSMITPSSSSSSRPMFQTIVTERRVEILPNVVLLRTLVRQAYHHNNQNNSNNNSNPGNVHVTASGDVITSVGTSSIEKEISSGPIVQAITTSEEPRVVLFLDTGWFQFLDKAGSNTTLMVLPKKRDVKLFAALIEKHLLKYSGTGIRDSKRPTTSSSSYFDASDTSAMFDAGHSMANRIIYAPRMSAEVNMPLGVTFPTQPVFVGEDGEIRDYTFGSRSAVGTGANKNQKSDGKDGGNNDGAKDEDDDGNQLLEAALSKQRLLKQTRESKNSAGGADRVDLSLIRDLELRRLLEATGDATTSDVNTFLNFGVTPLAPAIVETAGALLHAAQSSNPSTTTLAKLAEAISTALTSHEISGRLHLALPVCKAAVVTFHALIQLAYRSPYSCAQDGVGDSIVAAIERCVSCLIVGGYESCFGQEHQQQSGDNNSMDDFRGTSFSQKPSPAATADNSKFNSSSSSYSASELSSIYQMTKELSQHLASALILIENYHALMSDRIPVSRLWARNNNNNSSYISDDAQFANYVSEMDGMYQFMNGNKRSSASNSSSSIWLAATAPMIQKAFFLMTSLITPHPHLSQKIIGQELADMFPSNIVQATHSTATTFLSSSASAAKTKNSDAFVSLHCCLSLSKLATKMLISWTNRALASSSSSSSRSSTSSSKNNAGNAPVTTSTLSGQVILRSCASALNFCTMLLENSISERCLAAITSRSIVNREGVMNSARHLLVSKAWELDSREAMFRIFHLHVRLSEVATYLATRNHHQLLAFEPNSENMFRFHSNVSSSSMCWDQVVVILSTPLRRSAAWFGSLFPPSSTSSLNGGDADGGGGDRIQSAYSQDDDNNTSSKSGNTSAGGNNNAQYFAAKLSSTLEGDLRQVMARAACRFLAARSTVEGMTATSVIFSSTSSALFDDDVNFSTATTRRAKSPTGNRSGNASKGNHLQYAILPTADFQPGAVWLVRAAVLCGATALRTETIGAAAVLLRLQMNSIFSLSSSGVFNNNNNHNSNSQQHRSADSLSYYKSTSSTSHLARIERVWTRWCAQLNAVMSACPQPSTAHSVWSTANLIVHRFAQSAVIILQKSSGITNMKEFSSSSSSRDDGDNNINSSRKYPRKPSPNNSSSVPSALLIGGSQNDEAGNTAAKRKYFEDDDKSNNPPLLCATMILSVPTLESLKTFSSPQTAMSPSSSVAVFMNLMSGNTNNASGNTNIHNNASSTSKGISSSATTNDQYLFASGSSNNNDYEDFEEEDFVLISRNYFDKNNKNDTNNTMSMTAQRRFNNSNNHNADNSSGGVGRRPPDASSYLSADSWDGLAEYENDRPTTASSSTLSSSSAAGMNNNNENDDDALQDMMMMNNSYSPSKIMSSRFDDSSFYDFGSDAARKKSKYSSNSVSWLRKRQRNSNSNETRVGDGNADNDNDDDDDDDTNGNLLSLTPNVQDEAFWYIDKSCQDRQEQIRLMTASRRRLLAVQDARNAAAAPPSRCAVFAARAIRDFARAFYRSSQDIFDDTKCLILHQQNPSNNNSTKRFQNQHQNQQQQQHTISLICQELSNLFFFGTGSVQHASLALLPVLACVKLIGDKNDYDDLYENQNSENQKGRGKENRQNSPSRRFFGKNNNNNNLSAAFLLENNNTQTGNLFSTMLSSNNNNSNNTRAAGGPMKKESILISTLRTQKILNQGDE